MPVFDSAKGDIPWYAFPNSASTLFGGSVTSMQEEGTLYRYASAGISPAILGADNVVGVFAIPANSFDGLPIIDLFAGGIANSPSNRGVGISVQGSFGPTNATNKRVKIFAGATSAVVGSNIVGGTVIADTGVVTTVSVGWSIGAELYKYGAAGSNTQVAIHQQAQVGAVVSSLLVPQALTLNEAGNIIIAVTANATTAFADITMNLFVVTGFN